MKNKNIVGIALITLLIGGLFSACLSTPTNAAQKLNITVSILPQKYFVERIAGDLAQVNVMVGPGESPHTYEPQPAQMEALSNSSIYFLIGVEFEEAWIDKFKETSPDTIFIDTSEVVQKIPVVESEEIVVEHQEGDHDHGSLDPHIWLSTQNVIRIANAMAAALSEIDPENSAIYQQNLEDFVMEIDTLDEENRAAFENISSLQFITFHPSWGYFARDYGLQQIPIEVGGNEPSAQELTALIEFAKENDIRIIFASPEFNTRSAETIASEIEGEVILISPLAEDWMENMRTITNSLSEILQ
jgi:zinc transport system substrate-binding protein